MLERVKEYGLRVKQMKCEFLNESVEYLGHKVEYLGHKVDAEELHALPTKVTAIVEAPELQNVQELRSFLGLLNYNFKFIPNLARYCIPVMLVKLNVNLRAMQTIVMVLKTRSQAKCRNRANHRNLNLYDAILNELVDTQTCVYNNFMFIDVEELTV